MQNIKINLEKKWQTGKNKVKNFQEDKNKREFFSENIKTIKQTPGRKWRENN